MQNFPNSPAPPALPPGFTSRGGGGSSYPPPSTDPQISPRMTDDYTGMQQQTPPNPQSHSRHLLHRGHHHPSQAGHMLAYDARNRAGESSHGNIHSGSSSNPYQKETMDYYFAMGGKDRHRRGGMAYGAGFGYSNMDGHIPQQYRQAGTSSSGMMSPYPLDYGSTAGSGGSSSGSSGMQHRQHGQNYPAHQALQHGQQHRTYPISGHRMPPQFSHYSPQGSASTGSSGMYSSPPQRYHDGASSGGGFEAKVNNSPNMNSNSNSISSSATTNNVGSLENVAKSYHSSSYPSYSPQTHPLHKQATLQHRNSQHNLGIGYDNSLKMQHHAPPPGPVYSKHHQSTNPGMPQQPCQEIAKSPMHSQPQQGQINQNFSPISNPSPAASAVQSPSCSSSPSPLMGVSEGHGNPLCPPHVPSHPPPPNPRSCRGRLLQTLPQLSPTPNSNSSISSCGSSGSNKATDPGLNSLNALTSQVANLPNTVQHMLLTDTLISHRRGKDGQSQMLQALQAIPSTQPRSRSVSAASSSGIGGGEGAGSEAGGDDDSFLVSERVSSRAKEERDEQISEGEKSRRRQMSGTSSGSEPTGYYPPPSQSQMSMGSSKNQSHTGKSDQGSQGKRMFTESSTKPSLNPSDVSERKTTETRTPSLSSPSSAPQSAEPGTSVHSRPPVSSTPSCPIPSPAPQFHPNCATDVNTKNGLRKTREIKYEGIKDESGGMVEKNEKGTHGEQTREGHMRQDGQDKENKLDRSSLRNKKSDEKDGKRCKTRDLDNSNQDQNIEEQPNAGGVGVIVSTRCEVNHPEKATCAQDNCIEEKHSDSFFRESSRHNGEEGMDLSVCSSHHEVSQKSNFGRSVPQNHPLSGPQKYGYQESPHGAAMGLKNRGRPSPGSVTGSNSRYQGFHQPKPSYGPEHTKDVAGTTVEGSVRRREGSGARGHDDNSQLQHQFPSLLQEVLQGYHLDRRYGRSEQALTAHLQVISHPSRMTNTKGSHSASSEKNKMSTEFLSGPPPKHINLADYSLPHRKPPSGQIESQMLMSSLLPPSKERRSVICDVCPNRRSTPERDGKREREREKSPIGASVIQLPSTNDLGNSKEMGVKKEVGVKVASKETAEAVHHSGLTTKETDVEHHNKALHPSVVMNSEPLRRGKIDLTTTMPSQHLQQTSHYPSTTNPLSPPSRHQSYPHGVDLSTGHASGFPGSRFGDAREGNMIPRNPHFHNPYHSPQVQLQNPQSANKLQMYTHLHAHDLDDRLNWVTTINRPTKDMMQSSTSPGRHKLSHSEQRQRMQSPTDILHNRQTFTKQQVPHQNTYYDMKMWESTHSGRESVGMLEGDPYQRSQQPPPAAPLGSVAHQLVPTAPPVSNILESPVSQVVTEEIFKSLHPTPTPNSMKTVGPSIGGNVNSVMPQSHRPNKTGGSGDTNPLMLRRRVRSFISPIPAKRQHQDVSQQRSAPSSYHSPLAYSESSLQNDDDSSSSDITTLGSPNTPCPTPGQSTYSQSSSPVQGKKSLPPRKGRGLKLEAIVQKITPNVKKSTNSGHTDVDSNDFAGFSHTEMSQFTDTQDEEECLPYLDESLSLSDIMPYRGVDETGPLPPTAYPCDPHQTSQGSPPPDYYGTTPPHHSQAQGHLLRQPHQTSPRSSLAMTGSPQDSKQSDNSVPKGYFPSGKKKGRPVGSVNKQKRAQATQAQAQNVSPSALSGPPIQSPRRRRRGVAAAAAKDDLEAATRAGGHFDNSRVFPDNSKCAFAPYIHVERKVAEIGAVCTIVNGEEEKMKGERGRVKEKRELEDVDSALQAGKALPSSEYLLPGPVITESIHSGRLLCCLCQKWANYKNLGDLYGPYYPPEYATRLPKNQPQIRQSLVTTGMNRNVQNLDTISNQQQTEDTQQRPQHRKLTSHPRFKRRQKSSENSPRMVPSNSKASLPFQPPPPTLDSLGPLAQLAQLPQMPIDPEELWVHEACMVWTSGVYLVNGRLYGLQEALDGARDTVCSYCEMVGSTLGCYSKGCTLRYHYPCAMDADCSLNEDNFSLRCPKHKVKRERLVIV
uniref:Transcription factor 20 n=1 Tax=Oncorhynchus kisutch TaxID=8019 RepID=A0A8C7FH88_ONCKI